MNHRTFQLVFFFTLLIGVGVLMTLMLLPYASVLVLAATLAFAMQTPYQRLVKGFHGQKTLAAIVTTLLTILIVVVPLAFFGFRLFAEVRDLYANIAADKDVYSKVITEFVATYGTRFSSVVSIDTESMIHQVANWLFVQLAGFFSSTLEIIFEIFLGSIAMFYFLKDGPSFIRSLIMYSPMSDEHDAEILSRLGMAVNSVMKGSLLVALIQGLLMGLGLTVFGVPNPALWGCVAAMCALIPGVGTSLVSIPAVIYLFISGHTVAALGMAGWGAVAVGLIDNIVGPQLIGRSFKMHPFFVLLAVIGGVRFFGPLGILFGPLLLGLLFALLDIYRLMVLKSRMVM